MRNIKKLFKNIRNKNNKIISKKKINDYGILLEAGQGKNINGNMFAILKSLEYEKEWEKYEPYFVVTKDTIDNAKARFDFYGFKKVKVTIRDTQEYWTLLNTCKYIMTDNSYPTLYTKREGQIYLNTWHGTPLKYLGRSDIKNAVSLGNIQKNYFACDYALFPNNHTKDVFMKDYMLERMYKGYNLMADYPRNAALLNTDGEEQLKEKLGLKHKKVIAYMPTWRGTGRSADSEKQVAIIKEKLDTIDKYLHKDEILYVNLHFLVSSALDFKDYMNIRPFPSEYETYDFLNVCDVLISDYSSVFFDFAVTNKKIILYAYDREQYMSDKGMYMDMDTFPFPIVSTEKELMEEIHSDYVEDRTDFQNLYCKYADKDIVNKILRLLINNDIGDLKLERPEENGKKNVVYHVGNMSSQVSQGLIKKLVENQNLDTTNLTLCFEGGISPGKSEFIKALPEDVYVYSIVKADSILLMDRIFMYLYKHTGKFGRYAEKYLLREKNRLFHNWTPDEIHMYLYNKMNYFYIYEKMSGKKKYHKLPDDYRGRKVFKKWYALLDKFIKEKFDGIELYDESYARELTEEFQSFYDGVEFKLKKIHSQFNNECIKVKMKLTANSNKTVDFSSLYIAVGPKIYEPYMKATEKKKKNYRSWNVTCEFIIPAADLAELELQNKTCFVDKKRGYGAEKMRIHYHSHFKKIVNRLPHKVNIDETRNFAFFFKYPKDTLTLTVREKNVTDHKKERIKITIAYLISKLLFAFKPILLFEKNAARYEESASVVYEKLLDKGYKNVYFVLDKEYPFRDRILEKYKGHIVDKYSLKHYICFFAAATFIGSESKVHAIELRPISKLVNKKLTKSKHNYIFLQHGVMYMISLDAQRRTFFKKTKNSKIKQRTVVSSKLELQHFTDLGGYKEDDLYLCGLPKFDRNTWNENADKIVVMITWRPWEYVQSINTITETSYFKMLENIVNSIPQEYHKNLLVLPHPLVENQMRTTDTILKDMIPDNIKYDDILKETKILITDYSSISYDAFYRGCNVIFCWQEKDECLAEYGSRAKLMLTEELAFGDINTDYSRLAELVSYNYTHEQNKKHLENYEKLVNFHDGKNTDRLIELLRKDNII